MINLSKVLNCRYEFHIHFTALLNFGTLRPRYSISRSITFMQLIYQEMYTFIYLTLLHQLSFVPKFVTLV